MASASFRDSMNSLGWSRREPEPVNTSSPSLLGRLQNLNPFGDGGYVRLPITETNPGAPLPAPTRREEEEGWFARKSPSFPVAKHSHASLRVLKHHAIPALFTADRRLPQMQYPWSATVSPGAGLVTAPDIYALRLVSLAFPHGSSTVWESSK